MCAKINNGSTDHLPLTQLDQQPMHLQTAPMSVLATDWLQLPTSVSVKPSFSAAHSDFELQSQRHVREQLTHELPVINQQLRPVTTITETRTKYQ